MSYSLIDTKTLVATEILACDATRSYYQKLSLHNKNGSSESLLKNLNDMVIIMKFKNGKIEIGQKYTEYEFVDEDSGELLYLNCNPAMDIVAKKNKLYHPLILNQLT